MKQITITDNEVPKISQLIKEANKEANEAGEQLELRDESGSLVGVLFGSRQAERIKEFERRLDEVITELGGLEAFDDWIAKFEREEEKDPAEMTINELARVRRQQRREEAKARLPRMLGDVFTLAEVADLLGVTSRSISHAIDRTRRVRAISQCQVAAMIRTQIYLDKDHHQQLTQMARKQRTTVAALIREIVEGAMEGSATPIPTNSGEWALEMARKAEAMGIRGPSDLASTS